jgi:2-amino-4-hydroxy-6-hydroxymethyldihydropteridine diphosphokinase
MLWDVPETPSIGGIIKDWRRTGGAGDGSMRYPAWAPRYDEIRREFGYPFEREEAAARRLEELLRPSDRREPLRRVATKVARRDAIVVGHAPGAGPPPIWRLPPTTPPPAVIAADGATASCLGAGLVPDVIVTDLDGPVPPELTASERGSLVVVHAHGDNVPALERWVPAFPGELVGSWAGEPRPALIDPGGFTDGDRAAYLAEEVGARRILLWGFDFETVDEPDPALRPRKLAKLAWARRLLAELARASPVPILTWERTGRTAPYGSSVSFTR